MPTTGRNWLTRPTHSASATGACVPTAWKTIQWNTADRPGEQRPRVQVAAGLVDGQLPGTEHLHLPPGPQPAADRAAQPRPVGDEVEGEQHHRQPLEDHAEGGQRHPQRVVALVGDELLDPAVGVLDLGDHVGGVDVGVEGVVQEVDHPVHVELGVAQQLGDLAGDEGADGHQEHDEDHQHARRG